MSIIKPAMVALSDLDGFAKLTATRSDGEIFDFLASYYELIGDNIAPAGTIIKFMGDGALMLFPESSVDAGLRSLFKLRHEGDRYLEGRGISCRHRLRAHFGPVCQGTIGTRSDKRADVVGATVNELFLLKCPAFGITPEVYRKIEPETRSLFTEANPPTVYILLDPPSNGT